MSGTPNEQEKEEDLVTTGEGREIEASIVGRT